LIGEGLFLATLQGTGTVWVLGGLGGLLDGD
jgi:uncharacterized protein (AIM24 family)